MTVIAGLTQSIRTRKRTILTGIMRQTERPQSNIITQCCHFDGNTNRTRLTIANIGSDNDTAVTIDPIVAILRHIVAVGANSAITLDTGRVREEKVYVAGRTVVTHCWRGFYGAVGALLAVAGELADQNAALACGSRILVACFILAARATSP